MSIENYDVNGQRLTDCCSAYSTVVEGELVCKSCYESVPTGQGDGNEYLAPSDPDVAYMNKQILSLLVGGKIVESILSSSQYGDESFGFKVKAKNGKTFLVWVDCDSEGNGHGWLDIQEV